MDEDVFQVVPKTLVQQKQSKDYRQKVLTHDSLFLFTWSLRADVVNFIHPSSNSGTSSRLIFTGGQLQSCYCQGKKKTEKDQNVINSLYYENYRV